MINKSFATLLAMLFMQVASWAGDINIDPTPIKIVSGITAPRLLDDTIIFTGNEPKIQSAVLLKVTTPSKFVQVKARKASTPTETAPVKKISTSEFLLTTPGILTVEVTTFDPESGIDSKDITVVVGGDVPVPPTPTPTPTPTPPTPSVVPISGDGFRVLILYDSSQGVPESSVAKSVRDYLNAKCVKGADGKTADYRIWDINTDVSNVPQNFKDAFARKRDSIPWILISTGKTGYEGPLPYNATDLLPLLKKYGGE